MRDHSSSIEVRLWPEGVWTKPELDEFIETLSVTAPASGQVDSDTRGIEMTVWIAFATGAIASSFFKDLGSDLYSLVKKKLKDLLLKRRSPLVKDYDREVAGRVSGLLNVAYEEHTERLRVAFGVHYTGDADLERFFVNLDRVDQEIRVAHSNRVPPFAGSVRYKVHATLVIKGDSANWDLSVTEHDLPDPFRITRCLRASTSGPDLAWSLLSWSQS